MFHRRKMEVMQLQLIYQENHCGDTDIEQCKLH